MVETNTHGHLEEEKETVRARDTLIQSEIKTHAVYGEKKTLAGTWEKRHTVTHDPH